jgi:hypothetical protein
MVPPPGPNFLWSRDKRGLLVFRTVLALSITACTEYFFGQESTHFFDDQHRV